MNPVHPTGQVLAAGTDIIAAPVPRTRSPAGQAVLAGSTSAAVPPQPRVTGQDVPLQARSCRSAVRATWICSSAARHPLRYPPIRHRPTQPAPGLWISCALMSPACAQPVQRPVDRKILLPAIPAWPAETAFLACGYKKVFAAVHPQPAPRGRRAERDPGPKTAQCRGIRGQPQEQGCPGGGRGALTAARMQVLYTIAFWHKL